MPASTAETKERKKRRPADGPMQVGMKKFVDALKESGVSHKDAMDAWKISKERAAIVAALDPAEVKRRRY